MEASQHTADPFYKVRTYITAFYNHKIGKNCSRFCDTVQVGHR
jgi:hypothetical protein